jgi:hypothetical protein
MKPENAVSQTGRRSSRRLPISVPGVTTAVENVRVSSDSSLRFDSAHQPSGPNRVANEEHEREESLRRPRPQQPLSKVVVFGALGAILIAVSLGPFGAGQIAFLAIAPWAWLTLDARDVGRWGYISLFGSGLLMWILLLLMEVDLRVGVLLQELPVIAYLSCYVPLFIALGRMGRSLFRLPSYVTLPIIWCGLEWMRCHLFGGFSLGLLAHAAADTRRILQLTDLMGSYGLGILMVASGSSVAELVWVARRIRRLERRLPRDSQSEAADEVGGASARGGASAKQVFGALGRPKKKQDALTSMESVMRRHRDHARDVHLLSVIFSVGVIVGVLAFANSYGRFRMFETRTWKLFESNLFGITVLGGNDEALPLERESKMDSGSLIVACFDRPEAISRIRPPALTIDLESSDPSTWLVVLHRSKDRVVSERLELDSNFVVQQSYGAGDLPSCRFGAQPTNIPLSILVTATPASNIEQAVNECLRGEHERGKHIDFTLVATEPGPLDGSNWPQLLSRSLIAAAVANRCPVITMVPGRISAVANGDGKLWWSSAGEPRLQWGDPMTFGQGTKDPLRVQAMIDPRVSYFVSDSGSLPARLCAVLALMIPIGVLLKRLGKLRAPRWRFRSSYQRANTST